MVDHSCREGSTGIVDNRPVWIICLIWGEGDDKSSPAKKLKNQNSDFCVSSNMSREYYLCQISLKTQEICSKQNKKVANFSRLNSEKTNSFS